jgi:hypothetical protein
MAPVARVVSWKFCSKKGWREGRYQATLDWAMQRIRQLKNTHGILIKIVNEIV